MLVDAVATEVVQAGVVRWPSGRSTLILKFTLDLGRDGVFRLLPADSSEPLRLDTESDSGALQYPSDFAPYKPRADVIVLGSPERQAPGHLQLNELGKRIEAGESAGPRLSFCTDGDPELPEASALWSGPGFDFAKFQVAPPDQRIAHPTRPFFVDFTRGATRLAGRYHGPFPRAVVVDARSNAPLVSVPLALDLVALDPSRWRLIVVFRGNHADLQGPSVPERFAVEVGGASGGVALAWVPLKLARPADVSARRAGPQRTPAAPSLERFADETAALDLSGHGPALPFSAGPAVASPPPLATDPDTVRRESFALEETMAVSMPEARAHLGSLRSDETKFGASAPSGPPVPFEGWGARPSSPARAERIDLSALRAAPPVLGAREAGGSTATVATLRSTSPLAASTPPRSMDPATEPRSVPRPAAGWSPSAPLGPAPLAQQQLASPLFASRLSAAPQPEQAAGLGVAASPPEHLGRLEALATSGGPPREEAELVERVQREIWAGLRPMREVLSEHGLDESTWRELRARHRKPGRS